MRITQWGKKLKARVAEYMTRPRMIIRARSFYSRADMKLYMRKRIALAVFVGVVDLYVWSMVIIQSIPMVEHAMAGESHVIIREDSQGDERSSSTEPTPGLPGESTDGTVPAVPHTESEEGSESASAEVSAPSEDSIEGMITRAFPEEPRTAIAIAQAESGLNPQKESDSDRMADGRTFSVGLFQINLTVSDIAGLKCPDAFVGKNYDAKVKNEALYRSCVNAAKDTKTNIERARAKYESKTGWNHWSVFTSGVYKRFL